MQHNTACFRQLGSTRYPYINHLTTVRLNGLFGKFYFYYLLSQGAIWPVYLFVSSFVNLYPFYLTTFQCRKFSRFSFELHQSKCENFQEAEFTSATLLNDSIFIFGKQSIFLRGNTAFAQGNRRWIWLFKFDSWFVTFFSFRYGQLYECSLLCS